ncbi:microtubule nucleation factor SSNA1 isoform X2 [Halyomorpha halys]|uniref:microtubule nucleation factor SSNA1 isoform X2 n=1 Tax=Halyomorpha halys TaxID=286706 RepID=UPI0006D4FB15|nr:Sjoegren syndrome nuclear autoantigen 1 homolog isoform X2 [Halyomorpha halys]
MRKQLTTFIGIEQLKIKRQELSYEVEKEEAAKHSLENEMQQLQLKLDGLSTNIKRKKNLLENCDKAIKEAESAFMKILESSQVLLSKVLRESEELEIKDETED